MTEYEARLLGLRIFSPGESAEALEWRRVRYAAARGPLPSCSVCGEPLARRDGRYCAAAECQRAYHRARYGSRRRWRRAVPSARSKGRANGR